MWGGGKITPHSKIFKNDPKELKLAQKLEHIKIFPKHEERICSDHYFRLCQHFFGKKLQKVAKFLVNFKNLLKN